MFGTREHQGALARIRTIAAPHDTGRAADRSALAQLPTRVSPRSAIMRFHGALSSLSEPLLDRLLDLGEGQREAVVAVDEWHHRGVAHEMLRPLIASAIAAGIRRFRADMLAENAAARSLVSGLGSILDQQVVESHLLMTIELAGA